MLDKKDLSLYTQIGSGVEGIVYDIGNNNVAKIFNKINGLLHFLIVFL